MEVANQVFGVVFAAYDITTGYPISTPIFLALGRHDYVVPYYLWDDHKDKLKSLSHNLFEKSGHWAMLEKQELFNRKLIEWISSR